MEFFGGSTRARTGALDKGADVFLDESQAELLYADAKARDLVAFVLTCGEERIVKETLEKLLKLNFWLGKRGAWIIL